MIQKMVQDSLFLLSIDVLIQLIEIGCHTISPVFLTHLSTIPIAHYAHSLETAYSYIEILSGSISNEDKRTQCLQILLQDWYTFTTTSYVQAEYTSINDQLNQLSTLVIFSLYHYV